jgi:hypothetical protein
MVVATAPDVLDTLADCLESGDTLLAALEKVATASAATASWAHHVRQAVRSEASAAQALRASNVLGADELWLLLVDDPDAVASTLRVLALRRRRSVARLRAIRWGLAGPFGLGALTVVLDPLPHLITGEDYLWPVLRGLLTLLVLAVAVFVILPAVLRRPHVLRSCAAVPGVRRLAALYAEEELVTAFVPFVDRLDRGGVRAAGFTAAASFLAWSPLGDALRARAPAVESPSGSVAMGGLEPLAGRLSPATHLAIIGGMASKHLAERLTQRGEAIARVLTARLRLVARIGAYTLVILFSISSLAGMIARGIPGMPLLPGGATSPDEKQLEELLKQLQ